MLWERQCSCYSRCPGGATVLVPLWAPLHSRTQYSTWWPAVPWWHLALAHDSAPSPVPQEGRKDTMKSMDYRVSFTWNFFFQAHSCHCISAPLTLLSTYLLLPRITNSKKTLLWKKNPSLPSYLFIHLPLFFFLSYCLFLSGGTLT